MDRTRLKNIIANHKYEILDSIAIVILALFPLRHIHIGGDLGDTGYNYANFLYMGMDHMDPMWMFSTYISNIVGHFMTVLPFGDTVLGLNFYTALTETVIAISGYLFYTRLVKIPGIYAFLGEFFALCLCWCPTALLYNYLTYFFLFVACVLVRQGLVMGRNRYLAGAGALLGLNVFVRFSNLPEVVLILIVWIYCIYEYKDRVRGEAPAIRGRERRNALASMGIRTGLCIGGYLAAAGIVLLYIGLRYGFPVYFDSINRLMDMPESAADYSAVAMIKSIIHEYIDIFYWIIRGAIFVIAGVIISIPVRNYTGHVSARLKNICISLAGVFFAGLMIFWWIVGINGSGGHFCSTAYYSYDSMYRCGVICLVLMLVTALIIMVRPGVAKEDRLTAMIMAGVILVTPLGSNNRLMPALNNLFFALPFFIYKVRVVAFFKDPVIRFKKRDFSFAIPTLPGKIAGGFFLVLCVIQFFGFGAKFVFQEGTGVRSAHSYVENCEAMDKIRADEKRASEISFAADYVNQNGLEGREVIIVGNVPALSFYLRMPAAFNPWSILDSYDPDIYEEKLTEALEKSVNDPDLRPVIIVDTKYLYTDGEKAPMKSTEERKWLFTEKMITEYGYKMTWGGELFAIYE